MLCNVATEVVGTIKSLSAHNIIFDILVTSCFSRTCSHLNTVIPACERNGLKTFRTLIKYFKYLQILGNQIYFIMSVNGVFLSGIQHLSLNQVRGCMIVDSPDHA